MILYHKSDPATHWPSTRVQAQYRRRTIDGRAYTVTGDLALQPPDVLAELGLSEWTPPVAPPQPEPPLPDYRAAAIARNRAACTERIERVWSPGKQRSAGLGIYPPGMADEIRAWVVGSIAAENEAADAITAATTHAAVDAVVPNWPEVA